MFYVMGGAYEKWIGGKKVPVFSLVRPTGGKPYVTDKPSGTLFRLSQHHSHEYRLSDDLTTAILVQASGWAVGVGAPKEVTLTAELQAEVRAQIDGGEIYDR